ncbi:probable disease resistance protein At4g27220 [Gossypium hirsutum]|uniref:Probable disease resistance protein At4g27220 n=1 Tax=Gossypium hirsutum TaxID=3635 RepID=A0A1U8L1F8_GOSHI|nr:probable disease resistance protein At4g27220 [Gossypium hirsutum]
MEDLVRYAWGLNLYDKANSIEEMRTQVSNVIEYLKNCCLLEDGDVGRYVDRDGNFDRYVKLHDLVRDVTLWIASEEKSGFIIKSRLELLNKNSECCKAISLLDIEEKNLPNRLILSKLEILLLNNCEGSKSEGLADELGRLENLKMLDLKRLDNMNFPPNVIRRLSQLEELYLPGLEYREISNYIFLEIKFLTRLTRLFLEVSSLHFPLEFEFPELKYYNICINYISSIHYSRFEEARSLKVEKVFPYNAVSQLLGNLESLQVSRIEDEYVECLTNKTQQKVSASMILRDLKVVRIEYCKNLKVVFQMEEVEENEAPLLSNLKILHLQNLLDLSCIWELPTQHGVPLSAFKDSFKISKQLELTAIKDHNLVPEANEDGLNGVISLRLRDCTYLECLVDTTTTATKNGPAEAELIFSMEDIDSEDVNLCDLVNTQLIQKSPDFEYITLENFEQLFQLQGGNIISSLEKMELFNVIRLQDIWKGPIHVATNLRELRVHRCNNLTYIFPVALIRHLPQLSILNIASCENLKQIIGNDDILASSSSPQGPQLEMKLVFPQLKQIVLENLPNLESFSPLGSHLEFSCLDLLDIKQCSKVITRFSADYLTLIVHGKTDQASQLNDTSSSREDIIWERRKATLLPQYKEAGAEEISPFK